MTDPIALRLAAPADAAPIAALFTASRRLLTFLPELHTAEEDLGFIRDVVLPECRVTLAERDGVHAGFLAETRGWVEHLYLAPEMRRSGIGSLLLADAQARQTQLDLWCFRDNFPARAFYERHGFVAVEETDGAANEAGMPDIRYRWSR